MIHSIVGVYPSLPRTEDALRVLLASRVPLEQISLVAARLDDGRALHGYVTTRGLDRDVPGYAPWLGGIFGLLTGAAFLWTPAGGQLVAAGPLTAIVRERLERGGGDASATSGTAAGVLEALVAWGLADADIHEYEGEIATGRSLLLVYGSADQVEDAHRLLLPIGGGELRLYATADAA